jgi:hypothetical protein
VAKDARATNINEDDANSIYAKYALHSLGEQPEPTSNTFKANASKLRQIIKCAREHRDTVPMLEGIKHTHARAKKLTNVSAAYEEMVKACRSKLSGRL